MKKKKSILLLYVVVCILSGCSHDRIIFEHVLNQAEKQNADYDSITNLDSIKLAVEYFYEHGSANEQVRAYYLLGCAYRDMGEAPQALEYYQKAVENADTTQSDCDYRRLAKVHAQMANLFYQQQLPYEQLAELELQQRCAYLAKNYLSAINAIEHKAGVYELLNQIDSVIQIKQSVYQLYKQHGYEKEAALSVGPLIDKLVTKERLTEAKQYIDIYEKETGFGKSHIIEKRRATYYYIKGKYYLALEKLDSARFLFQKLLDPSLDNDQREAGYRGLYLLNKKTGQKDSLAKYADLCYQLNDASYASETTQKMQQMQALYNYSRSQKEASIMKERADRNKLMLMTAVTVLALIVALGIYIYQKKRRETEKLQTQYENAKANLEKARKEQKRMEEENSSLLEEKNNDIRIYEQQIREYEAKLKIEKKKVTNKELMETPIYHRLNYLRTHTMEKIEKNDWKELRKMIDEKIPDFYSEMHAHNTKLQQRDYDLCILVRLYFTPADIGILTDLSPSNISMKRIRLLKRIFGIDGSPEDFDKRIQSIC